MKIRWSGDPHPELEEVLIDGLDEMVREEPALLISHTHMLTDDMEGPSIHAYGEEGSDEIVAVYCPITKWVSSDMLADALDEGAVINEIATVGRIKGIN